MGPRDESLERLLCVDEAHSRGEIRVEVQFNMYEIRLQLLGEGRPHEEKTHVIWPLQDEGVVLPDEIFGLVVDLLADSGKGDEDGGRRRIGNGVGVAGLDF